MKNILENIFNINSESEFIGFALDIFRYQATENDIYKTFLNALNINKDLINKLEQIPFLPIEFFKSHKIITKSKTETGYQQPATINKQLFTSSGTNQSKHYVSDNNIYEKSCQKAFEHFYGNIEEYCILALLPSYLEREGSSLVYMTDDFIRKSKHADSGFYLNNYDELLKKLKQLEQHKQKTILLGVTYALLDFSEIIQGTISGNNWLTIMETGGMKGKRPEMVKEELHGILIQKFKVGTIHSEYGMTELLSQAYSKGNGIFYCPQWMKVMVRETNDPFSFLPPGKTGGINVIDLANINSCSFIATQDLGKLHSDNSFEVLGRFDNSDIRGCNLMMQ